MVALEEVGNLALAGFGIAKLSGGCGTAENEIVTLLGAVLGALVRIDQLLEAAMRVMCCDAYVEAVSTPCILIFDDYKNLYIPL